MSYLEALILGVVQGLTEFLPISSSGHLVIVENLLGLNQLPIHFDILLHVGTLVAICIFFSKKIKEIFSKHLSKIIIASIPAFITGFIIQMYLIDHLKNLWLVNIGLVITATFLLSTKSIKPKKNYHQLTNHNSLLIGISQALAIVPGVSRSGSTISTGLHLGLDKNLAFSFSFILSIPAILGALFLQIINISTYHTFFSPQSLVGFCSALITGLLALKLLKLVINNSKLYLFGYYCLILALLLFVSR